MTETFATEMDISTCGLFEALRRLGTSLGSSSTVLTVSPADRKLAHELVSRHGLAVRVIVKQSMKWGAWYIEDGTHRVWGSRGDW